MNPSSLIEEKSLQFRVVKVGGSLFTMPQLKNRIIDWSDSVAGERCVDVWVAGGGKFVDEVRKWQHVHGLDEEDAHRISIGLISQTAKLFQSMFLQWPLLTNFQQLGTVDPIATPNVVFDCAQWALNNTDLKRTWETTSDTISLRLATAIQASHLFLLKSTTPQSSQVNDLIDDGLIDRNFIAPGDQESQPIVSFTNLRASNKGFNLKW